jgi:hypothetical protein
MQLLYCDPGLTSELGHHSEFCRAITGELANRRIDYSVFACRDVVQKIQVELKAKPHFQCSTYGIYDHDPISWPFNNFEIIWMKTQEDMLRLEPLPSHTLVYAPTVSPAHFMGLVRWAATLPPSARPHVVAEFGLPLSNDPNGQFMQMFYRHVMRHFTPELARRFHLVTFDATTTKAYAQLLGAPVHTLPFPRDSATGRRQRGQSGAITVALIGHQRLDKGYGLVPGLLCQLLERPNIQLLIHNCSPNEMSQAHNQILAVSRGNPRVTVEENFVDAAGWAGLLDRADLIVCPYDPAQFARGHSGVTAEAIANAIPIVVPEGTSMALLLRQYGSPGTFIESFNSESTLRAILQAVDDFPRLARTALEASEKWSQTNGVSHLVDALLKLGMTG